MRYARLVVLVAGVACVLGGASAAGAETESSTIVSLRLSGVVDPFEADYISGAIADAEDEGAAAVLLTMDTPGGLDSSMRDITQSILNSTVPVICYTAP